MYVSFIARILHPDEHEQLHKANDFHEENPRLVVHISGIVLVVHTVDLHAYENEHHIHYQRACNGCVTIYHTYIYSCQYDGNQGVGVMYETRGPVLEELRRFELAQQFLYEFPEALLDRDILLNATLHNVRDVTLNLLGARLVAARDTNHQYGDGYRNGNPFQVVRGDVEPVDGERGAGKNRPCCKEPVPLCVKQVVCLGQGNGHTESEKYEDDVREAEYYAYDR